MIDDAWRAQEIRRLGRRRFLLVAAAGSAAALAAACQAQAPAPTTAPAAPAAPAAKAPEPASPAKPPVEWERKWNAVLAAARQEGRVTVYGPPGASYRPVLVDAFQQSFPDIKVDYQGADGAQQAPKLVAERQAGKFLADIYIGGSTSPIRTLMPIGAFDPIESALLLPEVTDTSRWFQNHLWFADKAGKQILAFIGSASGVSLVYNTKLLDPKEIQKATDLLDPKWKGKIVSGHPSTNGAARGNMSSVAAFHGVDFVRNLYAREHGVQLTADARQLADWVAQGQYPVGIGIANLPEMVAIGLPVDELDLQDVVTIGPGFGNVGLINQAPHPSAASVYLNWLVGKDGQIAYQKSLETPSLRTDVTREGVNPKDLPDPARQYVNTQHEDFLPLRDEVQKVMEELAANR